MLLPTSTICIVCTKQLIHTLVQGTEKANYSSNISRKTKYQTNQKTYQCKADYLEEYKATSAIGNDLLL